MELKDNAKPDKVTYEKTLRKGDNSTTVRVEQCENGYITSIIKDTKDENGEWDYDHKQYVSKNMPIKDLGEFEQIDSNPKDDDLFNNIKL